MPAGMQETVSDSCHAHPPQWLKPFSNLVFCLGRSPGPQKAFIHHLSQSSDPLEQTYWARKIGLTAPRSACLMTEDLPLAPSSVTMHCFCMDTVPHTLSTVMTLGEKECRAKLENYTTEGKMPQRDSNKKKKPRPAHQRLLH